MLAPQHHTNVRKAEEYFEEHLAVGDYYSEGQAVRGEWLGTGAQLLGLSGVVQKEDFLALCGNLHPSTGERLTARTKTKRRKDPENEAKVANRRLFYDFAISPPKSVSIAALVAGDDRIVDAHDRAVRLAMSELERFAATRVRRGGRNDDRPTGNTVTAAFRHDSSRALDPHLHSHCLVFNATFDVAENRWKALQTFEMFQAGKYVENVYYHELARDLRRLGYRIKNLARGDFELEGVSAALNSKFSKRHRQIAEQVRELLARSPQLATKNLAAVREHIAHTQRPWKSPEVNRNRLRQWWDEQLSADERQGLEKLSTGGIATVDPPETDPVRKVDAALRWAEEHLFARKSLVREYELWRFALERGRGESFTLDQLHAATGRTDYVRDKVNPKRLTTHPVIQREWDIVCLARAGVNKRAPLIPGWEGNAALDEGQQLAARSMMSCLDWLILFRGGAGTGKSFTLRAVHDALTERGKKVRVLAPQRQQVEGLASDGMTGSQTVSSFLTRQTMEPGTVVIVDEAGQIGARDMLDLMTSVWNRKGRLILSGDTRQHGAVQASDALWAIEKYARLQVAELNEIRRQNPAKGRDKEERKWIGEYKRAVEEAAQGRIEESFDRLDQAGALVECTPADQQERLAGCYLELSKSGQSTLVVSPTWDEIDRVNDEVRRSLQLERLIGGEDWKVSTLLARDLSDAQKRDPRYHTADTVIVFNQTARGAPKGATGNLVAIVDDSLIVETAGKIRSIPFKYLDKLTLCQPKELLLSRGDRLQLKSNAKSVKGERLDNGELVTVKRVKADGCIQLEDGRVLPPSYRQFVRGYAVTSYASQGKTVDQVLFSDSCIKAAINARQWYVTISRGARGVRIFTTDKKQLRENVRRSGTRELALDLTGGTLPDAATQSIAPPSLRKMTLMDRLLEMGRSFTTFVGIRDRTNHRRQIQQQQMTP